MKAFPNTYKHPTSGLFIEEQGMDLRDWFAGLAMQMLIYRLPKEYTLEEDQSVSSFAYGFADDMMEEREVIRWGEHDEGL
jgi:hypothetical protein